MNALLNFIYMIKQYNICYVILPPLTMNEIKKKLT